MVAEVVEVVEVVALVGGGGIESVRRGLLLADSV